MKVFTSAYKFSGLYLRSPAITAQAIPCGTKEVILRRFVKYFEKCKLFSSINSTFPRYRLFTRYYITRYNGNEDDNQMRLGELLAACVFICTPGISSRRRFTIESAYPFADPRRGIILN